MIRNRPCNSNSVLMPIKQIFFLILFCAGCIGCASFGRGIAEGIMASQSEPAECSIYSPGFSGLKKAFEDNKTLKVLNIHGIGEHLPGYSQLFLNRLSDKLGLNVYASNVKEMDIGHVDYPELNMGKLRVYKRYSTDGRTMYFYEYAWSNLTAPYKAELSYDLFDIAAEKRASLNVSAKNFVNEVVPDAVIYMSTDHRRVINGGVLTALCLMEVYDWDMLPDKQKVFCKEDDRNQTAGAIDKFSFAIISSSMGSLIAVDSLKWIIDIAHSLQITSFEDIHRHSRDIQLFMLSNQTPLLSLGTKKPEIYGQIDRYCHPEGDRYNLRLLNALDIVAFSDPNDMLTYAIPQSFINNYIDSRLCPNISNVIVNVTPVTNLLSAGKFANPLGAHLGYDRNEQVLDLIVNGVNGNTNNGCNWILTE